MMDPAVPEPSLDAHLDEPICPACSYSLAGLDLVLLHACPECGGPVDAAAAAIAGSLAKRRADAAWTAFILLPIPMAIVVAIAVAMQPWTAPAAPFILFGAAWALAWRYLALDARSLRRPSFAWEDGLASFCMAFTYLLIGGTCAGAGLAGIGMFFTSF